MKVGRFFVNLSLFHKLECRLDGISIFDRWNTRADHLRICDDNFKFLLEVILNRLLLGTYATPFGEPAHDCVMDCKYDSPFIACELPGSFTGEKLIVRVRTRSMRTAAIV
jgi:hypothetical protein